MNTFRATTAGLVGAVVIAVSIGALASSAGSDRVIAPIPVHGLQQATRVPPIGSGIHKIQHVVVIMQENRSFDSYFGTYPGADGIPMRRRPAACVPELRDRQVRRPFHDPQTCRTRGGPHAPGRRAVADIDGGQHGRLRRAPRRRKVRRPEPTGCTPPGSPT